MEKSYSLYSVSFPELNEQMYVPSCDRLVGIISVNMIMTLLCWIYVNGAEYIMALMSYSALCMLLPLIIIIKQDCSQLLNTHGEKFRGVRRCFLVYPGESVFKMKLVLVVNYFIFAIYGVVSVQLSHSSWGHWDDIFVTHPIIILKSEVSSFSIVSYYLYIKIMQICPEQLSI